MEANRTGTTDSISCMETLARSTILGSTGRDWGIHMLLPSRDTEGTAVIVMEERVNSMVQISTAAVPGLAAKTWSRTRQISCPLINSRMPATGIITTPRPQLSI